MPPKTPKTSTRLSTSGVNNTVTTGQCEVPVNVSTALSQLPIIQQNLAEINKRLEKLDVLEQVSKDIKADIWGPEGIDEKINNVAELSEHGENDIQDLRGENKALRKEVELLKSVVIKMDRRLTIQGRQITELRSRSMRENILIHNFEESPGEQLETSVPEAIRKFLGVDVEFVRIHRNGGKINANGKPRSITGKLVDFQKKFEIMNAQRSKRKASAKIPFQITPQSPPELLEQRKKLEDVSSQYRDKDIRTKFVGDKLVFMDGSAYKESVITPRAEDVLNLDRSEKESLDNMEVVTTKSVVESGNKFKGSGKKVKSINEVRKVYSKIAADPVYARADHNVLVYRIEGEEGYCDDTEFGAGKRMLKILREKNVSNVAVVVSRWYSGQQLGPKRFSIMEDIVVDVVSEIQSKK